ncbi:hypothetical protein [Nonomuraea sp. NPDC049400]
MNSASVDLVLISAWYGPQGVLISNDEVAAFVAGAPTAWPAWPPSTCARP